MKLTCIAVDDEPLALEQLSDFISRIPYLELKQTFLKGFEAMMYLKENEVDLVLLDIQMEDITGLQIIKTLRTKPAIVLTTAYQQYAIESYELDVSDYLLKPISFDRFVKAVNKVYDLRIKQVTEPVIASASEEMKKFIFIRADYQLHKIKLDEILFIEGHKDYLRFFLTDKRKLMSLMSFKSIEENISGERFFRVHKSFLIAVDKIDSVGKTFLKIGDHQIPIGEVYKNSFFEFINRQKL